MQQINDKIDKIQEDVTDLKVVTAQNAVILAQNTESLREHMKRTALNEKRLNILEGVWYAACAFGATMVGLYSMGILQKLF